MLCYSNISLTNGWNVINSVGYRHYNSGCCLFATVHSFIVSATSTAIASRMWKMDERLAKFEIKTLYLSSISTWRGLCFHPKYRIDGASNTWSSFGRFGANVKTGKQMYPWQLIIRKHNCLAFVELDAKRNPDNRLWFLFFPNVA